MPFKGVELEGVVVVEEGVFIVEGVEAVGVEGVGVEAVGIDVEGVGVEGASVVVEEEEGVDGGEIVEGVDVSSSTVASPPFFLNCCFLLDLNSIDIKQFNCYKIIMKINKYLCK